jgi:hypothetical protein
MPAATSAAGSSFTADNSVPLFSTYKGISIGMLTEQVRASLGTPKDSKDATDFFSVSDHEYIAVYYEGGRVTAFTITFSGNLNSAPTAKAVLGEEAEVKPDGRLFKMVQYPKAGFWVSYNKIAGDEPMVMIAVRKI